MDQILTHYHIGMWARPTTYMYEIISGERCDIYMNNLRMKRQSEEINTYEYSYILLVGKLSYWKVLDVTFSGWWRSCCPSFSSGRLLSQNFVEHIWHKVLENTQTPGRWCNRNTNYGKTHGRYRKYVKIYILLIQDFVVLTIILFLLKELDWLLRHEPHKGP